MIDKIFLVGILIFLIVSLKWIISIFKIKKFIQIHKVNDSNIMQPICIVIPVLDEEKRIKRTIDYFTKISKHFKKVYFLIISTEKEYVLFPNSKTIEIVRELSKSNKSIKHYHYPIPNSQMAHQINFGIREFIKENTDENFLFALYNSDSKPPLETFHYIKNYNFNGYEILQQYGIYLANLNDLWSLPIFARSILLSAGLWQTRWSLGFEIKNALFQKYARMNYCIGHGLFFNYKTFIKMNGFTEKFFNEDAYLGLKISYLGINFRPIPFLEYADSPDNLTALIKQKTTWFMGPFLAFNYYNYLIKELKLTSKKEKFKLLLKTFKLFEHSLRWILLPLLFLFLLIYVCFHFTPLNILLFIFVYLSYFFLNNILVLRALNYKKRFYLAFYSILGSGVMFILHGFSAYRAIYRIVISKLLRKSVIKEKTIMRV